MELPYPQTPTVFRPAVGKVPAPFRWRSPIQVLTEIYMAGLQWSKGTGLFRFDVAVLCFLQIISFSCLFCWRLRRGEPNVEKVSHEIHEPGVNLSPEINFFSCEAEVPYPWPRRRSRFVKKTWPRVDGNVNNVMLLAGFMTNQEKELFSAVPANEFNTYWIPCTWFIYRLQEASKRGKLLNAYALETIMRVNEIEIES